MNILAFVDGIKYGDSEIYKKVSEKLREAAFVLNLDTGRRSGNDGNCVITFSAHL